MQPDWSKTFWLNNSRAREKKQPLLEYVAVSGVKISCKEGSLVLIQTRGTNRSSSCLYYLACGVS